MCRANIKSFRTKRADCEIAKGFPLDTSAALPAAMAPDWFYTLPSQKQMFSSKAFPRQPLQHFLSVATSFDIKRPVKLKTSIGQRHKTKSQRKGTRTHHRKRE